MNKLKLFVKNSTNLSIAIIIIFIAIIVTLISYCDNDSNKHKYSPKPITTKSIDISVSKNVYVTDNINDENSAIVNDTSTVSYWYVYYTVRIDKTDDRYDGWHIIEISKPYYDAFEAIKKILPTYVDADYVGVQFFKRVPFETYKSYLINK